MAATVRRLLARPGSTLGLRLVAGRQGLDRTLSWVAVSELPDPTPYLEGGELVLLTGIGVELDSEGAGGRGAGPGPGAGSGVAADYVERLVARGVAALGLGVGIRYEQVPPALVSAAEAAGLPLLEVDRPTPFVAVSRAVAELIGADAAERARRRLDGMRTLTAELAQGSDPARTVRRLAGLVNGWAVLLDGRGAVVAASDPSARPRAAAELAERLHGRGPWASAASVDAGGRITVLSLGAPGRTGTVRTAGHRAAGYLAVGTPVASAVAGSAVAGSAGVGPTGSAGASLRVDQDGDHQLIAFAAALLTLDRERADGAQDSARWARSAAFALLAGLDPAGLAERAPHAVLGPLAEPTAPVRVIALTGADAGAVLDRLDDERRVLAWQAEDHTLLAVAADEVDDVLTAASQASGTSSGGSTGGSTRAITAGVSRPVPRGELAEAATAAVDLARRTRSGVARAEDAPPTLAGLLGEPAAGAFARAVLEPLDALEPADRETVEETLAAWLAANGETGAAAGVLGVHRHTLRERLRRSAQLLGRDLDDPQTRVDLWVALGARRRI